MCWNQLSTNFLHLEFFRYVLTPTWFCKPQRLNHHSGKDQNPKALYFSRIIWRSEVWELEEYPEHCTSLTSVHPSLKALYQLKISATDKKFFPQASCNIKSVSASSLFRFTQNIIVYRSQYFIAFLKLNVSFKHVSVALAIRSLQRLKSNWFKPDYVADSPYRNYRTQTLHLRPSAWAKNSVSLLSRQTINCYQWRRLHTIKRGINVLKQNILHLFLKGLKT